MKKYQFAQKNIVSMFSTQLNVTLKEFSFGITGNTVNCYLKYIKVGKLFYIVIRFHNLVLIKIFKKHKFLSLRFYFLFYCFTLENQS